jgi:hypothetical protein
VVAERLKITIQEVLDMPMSHFNLWIAYLKKEQDEYKNSKEAIRSKKD